MKKRMRIVGGSVTAVFILIFAAIPVSANIIHNDINKKVIDSKVVDKKNIKDLQKLVPPGWYPGWLIDILIRIFIGILFGLG